MERGSLRLLLKRLCLRSREGFTSGWGNPFALPWSHCHQQASCPCAIGCLGEALTSSLAAAGSRTQTLPLKVSLSKNVVLLHWHLPPSKGFVCASDPLGCTSPTPWHLYWPPSISKTHLCNPWLSNPWKQGHNSLWLRA